MLSTSAHSEVVLKNKNHHEDQSHLKIKSYQALIVRYMDENKILKANLIRAYAVLRYEFFSALMIALTLPIGCKKHFNFFDLNPLTLTKVQSQKRPTLLLHGACHNQGIWYYLAKTLQSTNLGPLFTVNIPFRITSKKNSVQNSFDVINKKITQIQQLYLKWNAEPFSINLIGYSAGAIFAFFIGLDKKCWSLNSTSGLPVLTNPIISNSNIHTVICIGNRFCPNLPNIYEIIGEEDVLVLILPHFSRHVFLINYASNKEVLNEASKKVYKRVQAGSS